MLHKRIGRRMEFQNDKYIKFNVQSSLRLNLNRTENNTQKTPIK